MLPTVCKENRDPKVFWHEKSGAYIMTLWLEENDFGIFRSTDLLKWEQTDGVRYAAYINKMAYAAQTYSNTGNLCMTVQ